MSVRASRAQNPGVDIGTGAVVLSDIMEEEEVGISIIGENTKVKEEKPEERASAASAASTYIQ